MSKHVTLIENLLRVTLTKDGPLVLFQSEEVERVAMIKVDGKNGFRKHFIGRSDQAFQHHLVGV